MTHLKINGNLEVTEQISGRVVVPTPIDDNQATPKSYVDNAIPHLYCHTIVGQGTNAYFSFQIVNNVQTYSLSNGRNIYDLLVSKFNKKVIHASGYYYLNSDFSAIDLCGILGQSGSIVFRGRNPNSFGYRTITIDYNTFVNTVTDAAVYTYQIS